MGIGYRLKLRIEELGIKQNELARRLEVSPTTLNGYFTGYREPDIEMIMRLSKELKVSVNYLITGESDIPDFKPGEVITFDEDGIAQDISTLPPEAQEEVRNVIAWVRERYKNKK